MGTPEVITTDEYRYYQELSTFSCPWKRNYRDCGLNNVCPSQPDPCDNCPVRMKFIWTRENLSRKEIDREYKKLEKACNACNLWQDYAEDNTHRTTCENMRHAKLILGQIENGKIRLHYDRNKGMEIPV